MKSIYREDYRRIIEALVEARKAAGITQQDLAKKLAKPQSFVSKIENGERRLDIVEFIQIARLVGGNYRNVLKRAGY